MVGEKDLSGEKVIGGVDDMVLDDKKRKKMGEGWMKVGMRDG